MENKQELVDRLLNGQSLYTVMIPDAAIPTNRPEHVEGLHLCHIVSSGDEFLGMSKGDLFSGYPGVPVHSRFCYGNMNKFFFNCGHPGSGMVVMDIHRYKDHKWHFVHDHDLIWDSNENPENEIIKAAIEDALQLKVAFQTQDNMWNFHPVEISYYNLEDGSFSLRTSRCNYPIQFRSLKDLKDLTSSPEVENKIKAFSKKNNTDGVGARFTADPFIAAYHIKSDGTLQTHYDLDRGDSQQPYIQAKIFAKKRTAEAPPFIMESYERS